MDYNQLCSKIIKIDPKIRLSSVYNHKLEKLAEEIQQNIFMHVPERITQETVKQALLRWESRSTMKEWIGTAKFAMAEYGKVKRFTFYLNHGDLLLISTEIDMNNDVLINKVLQYLE